MKLLSIAALAAALLVTTSPAFADPCKDGTAPAGWKRPGGYCEISRALDPWGKALQGGDSGAQSAVRVTRSGYYNGYTYTFYSNGTAIETVGDYTYTFQKDGSGNYQLVNSSSGFHF